jgi:hypothetical protein
LALAGISGFLLMAGVQGTGSSDLISGSGQGAVFFGSGRILGLQRLVPLVLTIWVFRRDLELGRK